MHNFHLVDERTAWLLGNMRVFGLGGGYSFSSFFNIGDGAELVGGLETAGRTWATSWQAGQLLELAQRFSSNARTETIVFATSVSTVVDPAMLLFAVAIKARGPRRSDRDGIAGRACSSPAATRMRAVVVLQAHVTVAPSTSSLAYCFIHDDVGDSHGGQLASTEARVLSAQAAMSKEWSEVQTMLLQLAEYAPLPA